MLLVEPSSENPAGLAVLLHGHGARPEELLDLATVLAERTGRQVALPGGSVLTGQGDLAWWEPEAGDPAAAATGLLERLEGLAGHTGAAANCDTVLVGFSQGGALASLAGAGFAATIIVAGFLPDDVANPFVAGQRLLVVHGEADDVVDPLHARRLARLASRAGANVATVWHSGGHEWTGECTEAVIAFLADSADSADWPA